MNSVEHKNREMNSANSPKLKSFGISLKTQNIRVFYKFTWFLPIKRHVICTNNSLINICTQLRIISQRQPDNTSVASEQWILKTQARGGQMKWKKKIYFFKQKKQNNNIWKKIILWTKPKSKVVDNPVGLEKLLDATFPSQYYNTINQLPSSPSQLTPSLQKYLYWNRTSSSSINFLK